MALFNVRHAYFKRPDATESRYLLWVHEPRRWDVDLDIPDDMCGACETMVQFVSRREHVIDVRHENDMSTVPRTTTPSPPVDESDMLPLNDATMHLASFERTNADALRDNGGRLTQREGDARQRIRQEHKALQQIKLDEQRTYDTDALNYKSAKSKYDESVVHTNIANRERERIMASLTTDINIERELIYKSLIRYFIKNEVCAP